MAKLTRAMIKLIETYNAGSVATVNDDGTPGVSPKATFVIVDEECLAFGNIRSAGTVKNIRTRPAVEINFIDVLTRRAVRVKGTAAVVEKDTRRGKQLSPVFERQWAPYLDSMAQFVEIHVLHAEFIVSPAYDIGHSADELRRTNLEKLNKLAK